MNSNQELIERYKYNADYIGDHPEFRRRIFAKTVVPYQVEFQAASARGSLCWLKCPFCYGRSTVDTKERLSRERALTIMAQIAQGGVRKIIFAGYCTDPLNCDYIDDLLGASIGYGQIFGFNTKALVVSEQFIEHLGSANVARKSYVSISVDAGSNGIYNAIHDVPSAQARLYDKVIDNIRRICEARRRGGNRFDVSATYLINGQNAVAHEIERFVNDCRAAGCNLLRFAFAQLPRGGVDNVAVIPSAEEVHAYSRTLAPVIAALNTPACPTFLVDADSEHGIFRKPRSLPCFARFVYPAVGFDGWLYHCSQSAAPHFRPMALGNLATHDFWELFYNYDADDFSGCMLMQSRQMAGTCCRCDRKEHLVNLAVRNSSVFHDLQPTPEALEMQVAAPSSQSVVRSTDVP